ncbi:MAG: DUF808 domain-containing protein [Burkholderiales bacterium]|nr:DUF808 domain-containing protein [Burkholderiales bacterium]
MAAASLLALLDDIATVLDDVSLMTQMAARKTAGVLGDDLALNAQQAAGVRAERELPVVWKVAKGSLVNKAILVPLALLISALAPWAVTPLLMIGGAYLCYEGVEKLWHRPDPAHDAALAAALADPRADMALIEADKIKGAIRTDFILSAEIITIALGTVAAAPLGTRMAVLVAVALLMTVGVYGLVAGIVKLDDAGLWLTRRSNQLMRQVGRLLVNAAPWLMKSLSVIGTAAMFLVGGGILVHGSVALNRVIGAVPGGWRWSAEIGVGLVVGALVLIGVTLVQRLLAQRRA